MCKNRLRVNHMNLRGVQRKAEECDILLNRQQTERGYYSYLKANDWTDDGYVWEWPLLTSSLSAWIGVWDELAGGAIAPTHSTNILHLPRTHYSITAKKLSREENSMEKLYILNIGLYPMILKTWAKTYSLSQKFTYTLQNLQNVDYFTK